MKALIIIVCLVILAPVWMPLVLALLGFVVDFWWMFAIMIGVMLFSDININIGSIGGRSYKSKANCKFTNREELIEKYKGKRVTQNNANIDDAIKDVWQDQTRIH